MSTIPAPSLPGAVGVHWSGLKVASATAVTLTGFAANSLLCRAALKGGHIDAVAFSTLRLAAGALALVCLAQARRRGAWRQGSWVSALALLAYAFAFSLAYLRLDAGVGAFLLFGSVQVTMIGWGLVRGERPRALEWLGLATAIAGLAWLGLPGAQRSDVSAAALMVGAGAAWGAYSLRGRGSKAPLELTAGNFWRAALVAASVAVLLALARAESTRDASEGFTLLRQASPKGMALAVVSGAITSGLVYALWYAVLPNHTATRAALVQLAVPVIAMAGGVALLGERLSAQSVAAGGLVLAGVAMALAGGWIRRR